MKEECEDIVLMLPLYLADELDKPEMDLVIRHLASCELCRQELTEISSMMNLLGVLEVARPSEAFVAGFAERIRNMAKTSTYNGEIDLMELERSPGSLFGNGRKGNHDDSHIIPISPLIENTTGTTGTELAAKEAHFDADRRIVPVTTESKKLWKKWISYGLAPAAAAVLVFIVARQVFMPGQDLSEPVSSEPNISEKAIKSVPATVSPQDTATAAIPTIPAPASPVESQKKQQDKSRTEEPWVEGGKEMPAQKHVSRESQDADASLPALAKSDEYKKARQENSVTKDTTVSSMAVVGKEKKKEAEQPADSRKDLDKIAKETESSGYAGDALEETEILATGELLPSEGPETTTSYTSVIPASPEVLRSTKTTGGRENADNRIEILAPMTAESRDSLRHQYLAIINSPEFLHTVEILDMVGVTLPLTDYEAVLLAEDGNTLDDPFIAEMENDIPLLDDEDVVSTLAILDSSGVDKLRKYLRTPSDGGNTSW